MNEQEKIRLDKFLWAIRIFKTRTQAATACDKGKIKCNGSPAKAAKQVIPGDEFEIKTASRRWHIKVKALLQKRVKHEEAVQYYIDTTPEEEMERLQNQAASFHTGKRQSKIGRPTKKERRDLENLLVDN